MSQQQLNGIVPTYLPRYLGRWPPRETFPLRHVTSSKTCDRQMIPRHDTRAFPTRQPSYQNHVVRLCFGRDDKRTH
jgi:hypothetical protein